MSDSQNCSNSAEWEVREVQRSYDPFLVVRIGADIDLKRGNSDYDDLAGAFELKTLAELYLEIVEECSHEESDNHPLRVITVIDGASFTILDGRGPGCRAG